VAFRSLAPQVLRKHTCESADGRLLVTLRSCGIRASCFDFVPTATPFVVSQTRAQLPRHPLLARTRGSTSQ
jgi:hypothetical protein